MPHKIKMDKAEQIFVVGYSRSGTTMMGRVMGRNAEVFTFHEIHFFEQLYFPGADVTGFDTNAAVKLLCTLMSIERQGYLQERNPLVFEAEATTAIQHMKDELHPVSVFKYFLKYESERNGKKISCDQTPRNALFIEEILKMYPRAFIIAMIRDPRDVLLSQKGKWKRRFLGAKTIPLKESLRSWLNYHPITITKLWSASTRTILKYNNHERVRIVRFEDLIENPEKTVQQLCAFTGLTYTADMLRVPKVGSSNAGDSPAKIGISSDNKGNFMKGLSHSEIYLCEKNTEQLRQQLNYPSAKISVNPLMVLFHYCTFPVKLFFALLFNLGRTKNLWATIKRRLK